MPSTDASRSKQIRRSALVVGLVALAFYAGFIVMAMMRGSP